jgi:hypothetical protein
MAPTAAIDTGRHAVTSQSFRLEGEGLDRAVDKTVGTARLEVTPSRGADEIFVGVARSGDADVYLRGIGHAELDELVPRFEAGRPGRFTTTDHPGSAPAQWPTDVDI